MPSPEQDACYVFWAVDSEGRIGLFVGNNPINNVDPLGLFVSVENPIVNPNGPYAWQLNSQMMHELTPLEVAMPFMGYAAIAGAATGIGALVESYGASVMGWLGLGGAAVESSPQAQSKLNTARQLLASASKPCKTVMNLTDRMGGNQFRKLVESIKQNGLQDKVINYVKIGDENYVVLGNNRLQAARQLGITDQLTFEEVQLPFRGFKTANDVITAAGEVLGGH